MFSSYCMSVDNTTYPQRRRIMGKVSKRTIKIVVDLSRINNELSFSGYDYHIPSLSNEFLVSTRRSNRRIPIYWGFLKGV